MVSALPPAPLDAHHQLLLLAQMGLLLGLALALGRLAVRLGMPALIGELLAGVLLGPSIAARLLPTPFAWIFNQEPGQMHLLDAVGLLGVLLLVALTGMQLDLEVVRRRHRTTTVVSAGGLFVPLALGCGVGLLVPAILIPATASRPAFALFLGVAMCVSAIPVIAKTLLEMRLMHRDIGQLILGSATVDDLVGWVLLSVATAIATASLTTGRVLMALGAVVVAIVAAMFVGRPAVNATFRLLNRNRSESSDRSLANNAGAVTIILLCAAGTVALRLEAVLGALLAGILIGTCRHVDRAQFRPLQTVVMAVLAPLFFATVGLRVDLAALMDPLLFGIAMVILVAAVAGKFIGAYLAARVIRLSHWEGLALGAGLNARGVIEVIVAYVGLRIGVLTTGMFTVIILVAVVTSLMAPPLLRYAARRIPVTDTEEHRQLAMQI